MLTEAEPRGLRSGVPTAQAWAHYVAGELATEHDPQAASVRFRAAIECGERADSRLFVNLAGTALAAITARDGGVPDGLAALGALLERWLQLGNATGVGWTLQQLAILLVRAGADADALTLAGTLDVGETGLPRFAAEVRRLRRAVDTARARLGEPAAVAALAHGATLDPNAVLSYARQALARAATTPAG